MFLHEKLLKAYLHSLPEGEAKILLSQFRSALEESKAEVAYTKLQTLLDPGSYHAYSDKVRLCICLHITYLMDYWLNRLNQLRESIAGDGLEVKEDKSSLDEYELKVRGLYDAVKEVDENPPPRYWVPQLNQLSAESRLIFLAVLADTLTQHRRYLQAARKYRQILMYSPVLRDQAQKALLIPDAFNFSTAFIESRLVQINDYFIADEYIPLADHLFHEAVTESNQQRSVGPFIEAFKNLAPFLEYWLALEQRETVRKVLVIIRNAKKKLKHERQPDNFFDLTYCYVGETSFNRLEVKVDSKETFLIPVSPYPQRSNQHRALLRSTKQELISNAAECKDLDEFLPLQKECSSSIQTFLRETIEDIKKLLIRSPCASAVIATGSIARGTFALGSDVDLAILVEHKSFATHIYFKSLITLLSMRLLCLGNDSLEIDEGDIIGIDAENPTHIGTPEDLFARYHPRQMLPESRVADRNHILIYAQLRPILLHAASNPKDEQKTGLRLFEEYTGLITSSVTSYVHPPTKIEAKEKVKGESQISTLTLGQYLAVLYFQKHNDELRDIILDTTITPEINFKKRYVSPSVFCCTNLALYFGLTCEVFPLPLQQISPVEIERVPFLLVPGQPTGTVIALSGSLTVILGQLSHRLDSGYCAQVKRSLTKLQMLQIKFQAAWHEHYGSHNLSAVNLIYNAAHAREEGAEKNLYLSLEEESEVKEIDDFLIKPTYRYMGSINLESAPPTHALDPSLEEVIAQLKLLGKENAVPEADIVAAFTHLIKVIYYRHKNDIYSVSKTREMLLEYYLKIPHSFKIQYLEVAKQQVKYHQLLIEEEWLERLTLPDGENLKQEKQLTEWQSELSRVFQSRSFTIEMVADIPVVVNIISSVHFPSGSEKTKAVDVLPKLTFQLNLHKKYTFNISLKEITKIFSPAGDLLEEKDKSQYHRLVFCLRDQNGNAISYFKVFPERPGNQLMVDFFSWTVGGYGAQSKIAALEVEMPGKKTIYPILMSKPARFNLRQLDQKLLPLDNIPTLKHCDERLDEESFTAFVITSLWINPEDEQWKNIGVEEFLFSKQALSYRLTRFDGDHVFVDELGHRQTGLFFKEKVANVKSAAFCLDAMKKKLDKAAILRFLNLNIGAILNELLVKLDAYNQFVCQPRGGLFSEQLINDWKEKKESLIPGLVTPNLLQWLFYRGQYIKGYLFKAYQSNQLTITHNQLRDALLPQAAAYYQQVWANESASPSERFNRLPTNYKPQKSTKVQLPQQVGDYKSSFSTSDNYVRMGKDWPKWVTEQSNKQLITYLQKFIEGYSSLEEGMKADVGEWILFLRRLLEMLAPTPSSAKVDLLEQLNKLDSLEGFQTLHQLDLRPHAEFVTDTILSQLVQRLPHLRKLDVSDCTRLTVNLFRALRNSSIKHLIAKQYQQDIDTAFGVFIFPELETLILDGSARLKMLAIQASKLKFLSLLFCTNLTKQGLERIRLYSPEIKRVLISGNESLKTLQGSWPELEELAIEMGSLARIEIKAPKLKQLSLRNNRELTYVNTNSQALAEVYLEGCTILAPGGIAGSLMDGRFVHSLTSYTVTGNDNSDWQKAGDHLTFPAISGLWFALEPSVWDEFNKTLKKFVDKFGKGRLAAVVELYFSNYLAIRETLKGYDCSEITINAFQSLKKDEGISSETEAIISYFGPRLPLSKQAKFIDELLQGVNHKERKIRRFSLKILKYFSLTASTKYRNVITSAIIKSYDKWLGNLNVDVDKTKFLDGLIIVEVLSKYRIWTPSKIKKNIVLSVVMLQKFQNLTQTSFLEHFHLLSASLHPEDLKELFLTLLNLLVTDRDRTAEISSYLQSISLSLLTDDQRDLVDLLIARLKPPSHLSNLGLTSNELQQFITLCISDDYLLFAKGMSFLSKCLIWEGEKEKLNSILIYRIKYRKDSFGYEELASLQAISVDVSPDKQEELVRFLIKLLHGFGVRGKYTSQEIEHLSLRKAIEMLGSIAKKCLSALRTLIFNEFIDLIKVGSPSIDRNTLMQSLSQFIVFLLPVERTLLANIFIGVISVATEINEITSAILRACRSEMTEEQNQKLITRLIQMLGNYDSYRSTIKKYLIILELVELSPSFSPSQRIQVIDVIINKTRAEDISLKVTAIHSIAPLCNNLLPHEGAQLFEKLKQRITHDVYQENSAKVLFEFCKSYGLTCHLSECIEMFNWLLKLLSRPNKTIQQETVEAFSNFGLFMAKLPIENRDQLFDMLIIKLFNDNDKLNRAVLIECLCQLSSMVSLSKVKYLVNRLVYLLENELYDRYRGKFLIQDRGIESLIKSFGIISRNFTPDLLMTILDNLIKMYNSIENNLFRLLVNRVMLEIHQNAGLNTILAIADYKPDEEKQENLRHIATTLPLDSPPSSTALYISSLMSLSSASASSLSAHDYNPSEDKQNMVNSIASTMSLSAPKQTVALSVGSWVALSSAFASSTASLTGSAVSKPATLRPGTLKLLPSQSLFSSHKRAKSLDLDNKKVRRKLGRRMSLH